MADINIANHEIAGVLDHIAELLDAQGANIHRVRAYRNGAKSVRDANHPLAEDVRSGHPENIQELPGIGEGLGRVITTYVTTGRSNLLDHLMGEVDPEDLFMQAPGIGKTLAARIAEEMDIHTLEELERASHDGRLQTIEGFGEKRVHSVRVSLAGMLSRGGQYRSQRGAPESRERERPDVGTLLVIDAEYRWKAERGELHKIAPRRFNPEGKVWLPILNTQRDGWDFTVLYSNTERAHRLEKTHDWVVIYYERDRHEDQATVVTQQNEPMKGKRVVRGREVECKQYYEQK